MISEDTLWACTTCGYCEAACPIELEHLGKFFRMRQHQVMIAGEFPHALKKVFEAWEVQSNPWGMPAEQRGDWARGLGVPVVRRRPELAGLDYLFYVGSAMSFDPRGQKIARAFVTVLQHAGVRFGILGAREGSTGECARRLGNEMLFQQLAAALVGTLGELGVTRIVTCDPHALNSLRNEYPEFGGHYELIHHTRLIADLLQQGRIRVEPTLERVIYHDPCYLGRHNGEFDAPRAVLARLCRDAAARIRAVAREGDVLRRRRRAHVAGGDLGTRINVARVEQALVAAPKTIATACPYCAVMMGDGLGSIGKGESTQSRDIAELVAEALVSAAGGRAGGRCASRDRGCVRRVGGVRVGRVQWTVLARASSMRTKRSVKAPSSR